MAARSRRRIQLEALEDRRLLALLGVDFGYPSMFANSTGTINYDATTNALVADASPELFQESEFWFANFIDAPKDFSLQLEVDESGNLVGGVPGDDFVLSGVIDIDFDGTPDLSGTLLTGEVIGFGFLNSVGTTDTFDFRIEVTGGVLTVPGTYSSGGTRPAYFAGQDIGMRIDSEESSFNGSFNSNFSGKNKATFGPTDPLAELGNYVWVDTNQNGLQDDGNTGVNDVTVDLYIDVDGDGIAEPGGDDGAPVATTVTADLSGTPGYYLFPNLDPDDYFVVFDPSTLPTGFEFTTQGAGSDDAVDSDADTTTGIAEVTTLDAGESDLTWDAGIVSLPGPVIALEKFTRVDDNPIDIEKLVRVVSPAVEGDVCDVLNKPVSLTFEYVPSLDFNPLQPDGKAGVLVNHGLDADGDSYIVVAKNDDPDDFGEVFFQGDVSTNELFTASGAFGSNTYFFIFDSLGGTLLQEFHYHTSCSAPIVLGAQPLSATLVGYNDGTPQGNIAAPDFAAGVNDADADAPMGPEAHAGDTVVFTYVVTNPIPNTELTDIQVSDLVLAPDPGTAFAPDAVLAGGFNVGDSDQDNRLDAGEQWLYTSVAPISSATPTGQHVDKATVVGTNVNGGAVMDMDPAHFFVPSMPTASGDVCDVLGKPLALTFQYSPGTVVSTDQDSGKATVFFDSGAVDDDGASFVIVTDKSNASDALSGEGKRYFEGSVAVNAEFTANEDLDDFGSTTYIHFFDDASGGLLQSVVYHTSCSQPIQLGDVVGNATLVGYQGEDGSAVLPPPPVAPPPVDLGGVMLSTDQPFNPANIGVDADVATGPIAQLGQRVTFTYQVTNPGNVPLTVLSLFDDNETAPLPGSGADDFEPAAVLKPNGFNFGDDNNDGWLDPGEVWYYQAMTLATTPGQHTNIGKVSAEDAAQTMVMADDPSNHLVNPIEFEKYVFVQTELPEQGDVCDVYGKAVALTFEYVPGVATNTEQDSAKAAVLFDSGMVDDDGVSHVIVTDESDASSALGGDGKRFFEGEVAFGELFEADESVDDFGSTTYVHFFDDATGGLLQTIVYHTSCSQPIRLGDVIGNATVVEYDGEDGSVSLNPSGGLGDRADSPTGPYVVLNDNVVFNFEISNTSAGAAAIELTDVVVMDDGVVITDYVDKGNGDDILDPGETWILTATQTAAVAGQQMNLGELTAQTPDGVELAAEDPAYYFVERLKFHVVDEVADADFRYTKSGQGGGLSSGLDSDNSQPRGAVTSATGDTLWVVDKDKQVYVYDGAGNFQGEWKAKGISDKVQGIGSDGQDVWIVDDGKDRVYFYAGGASNAFDQEHDYTSQFDLANDNDKPRGLTTDGTYVWVVNDGKDGDNQVFKYTVTGTFVSSWTLDAANEKPRGLTIDPTGSSGDTIWVVDETGYVFTYADGASDAGGGLAGTFALAAGNTKPQGIADPDPNYRSTSGNRPVIGASTVRPLGRRAIAPLESLPGTPADAIFAVLSDLDEDDPMESVSVIERQQPLAQELLREPGVEAVDELFALQGNEDSAVDIKTELLLLQENEQSIDR
ncbi:DUF7467 domain-containing protein [Roseimaritima ulvae]|nr:SdrD B-like domain-containing protein [Roseimaritima ulvae]